MLSKAVQRLDKFCRVASPFFSFAALVSGSFLTYDFQKLYDSYPGWIKPIAFMEQSLPACFFISATSMLILALLHLICQPSLKKISKQLAIFKRENEIVANNIKNVFDGYLFQLSKKLTFGVNGINSERVTIYIHNSNGSFIPFGRYSANPAYSSPGRSQYPDNQGCISHGWTNGWHFDNNFGSARTYSRNNLDRYSVPEAVTANIKMKSILYGVKRIDNGNGQPLAVIVVESVNDNRYTSQQLKDLLDQEEGVISELISKLRAHIPELSFARSRGF